MASLALVAQGRPILDVDGPRYRRPVPRQPNMPAPMAVVVPNQAKREAQLVAATSGTGKDVTSASIGGFLKAVGRVGIGVATGGIGGGITAVGRELTGRGGQSLASGCAPGFEWDGSRCVQSGLGGAIARGLPFGSTGVARTYSSPGVAVIGAFGLPAMEPAVVGNITRNDGSTGPILRCGRRMVLGADNLCYPKALLGRRSKFRKWRQPTRPPVTGADMAAIRRAARTKDRVKELAGDVGFTCSVKGRAKRRK